MGCRRLPVSVVSLRGQKQSSHNEPANCVASSVRRVAVSSGISRPSAGTPARMQCVAGAGRNFPGVSVRAVCSRHRRCGSVPGPPRSGSSPAPPCERGSNTPRGIPYVRAVPVRPVSVGSSPSAVGHHAASQHDTCSSTARRAFPALAVQCWLCIRGVRERPSHGRRCAGLSWLGYKSPPGGDALG